MARVMRKFCEACRSWWHRNRVACLTCGGPLVDREFPPRREEEAIV
jgi:hypothetical protein